MRNTYKYIYITLLLFLLLSITACNSGLNNINTAINTQDTTGQETETITESNTGSASFKIVIPDYYAMAGLICCVSCQEKKAGKIIRQFTNSYILG